MTVLSVLAPSQGTTAHLGTIAKALEDDNPEAFFAAFVKEPELAVEALTGDETWPKKQAAIVEALAAAADKKARDAIKLLIPAIVPGRFAGARRLAAECLGRQVVMHDFDAVCAETFDDACERIRAQLPDRFLAIHTTATERNEDGSWRLRAVEVLDREATLEEWERKVKPHMQAAGADKQTLDIARLLYVPVRTAGYSSKVYEGPRTKLEGLVGAPVAATTTTTTTSAAAVAAPAHRRNAAAAMLGAAWPSEDRHTAQRALAGGLCHDGWHEADAVDFVCAVCRAAGDEDRPKREKTVRDTYKAHAEGRPYQGWTALKGCVDGVVVDAARGALDRNADGIQALAELIRPKPADTPASDALPAQTEEHFSSRIKRGKDWGEPYVRPPYLLEGLIPFETVATFFAEGGSVKSWTAFALAISVASGAPWLDQVPVAQGKVLILDYEDGWAEFRRRKEILLKKNPDLDLSSLEYLYCGPNIADRSLWVWLETQNYTLIVIDALSSAMPSDADENDQRFSDGIKAAGRFVSATRCNVVNVHHANKSGGIRGSSSIRDQSDVVFQFVPVSETDNIKRMRMECNKPGPQKRPAPVNIELNDHGLTSFKDEANDAVRNAFTEVNMQAAIRLALAGGPVSNIDTIRSATKKKQNVVEHALKEMVQTGEVVRLGKQGYALDSDEYRTRRVLEQIDSGKAFATITEISKHAFVEPLFVDALRLKGVICQSADGRWMRINK